MNGREIAKGLAHAGDAITFAQHAVEREQWVAAMEGLERFSRVYSEVVAEVCQAAYFAGITKREIARTMNIPLSYLRDLKRTDAA